ncbi:MAG: nuclease-related domain-containing protein [Candidatus Poribacteria bacterium]|nr:nuclease-related domain-containing protein [Candidatus Poribacteria bacterium]
MAIMIPDQISDRAPQSEKIIFENLMHAPEAREWVIFYSTHVDNPSDATKPYEIDFLIIIPEYCAVICLETKGGSYEVKNGRWYLLPSGISVAAPIQQVRRAMFALGDTFPSHFKNKKSLFSLRSAVAFTHSEFPTGAKKPREALIMEKDDVQDPNKLCEKLANYATTLLTSNVKELIKNSPEKCQEALDNLRCDLEPPDMTIKPPPERIFRADLETLRPQLLRLTLDQLNSLKRVELNDRCVITGAAGTGKTVLAMELAKRRWGTGETVALLCSNPYLSRRFERWAETLPNTSSLSHLYCWI